jgi:Ribonuclease HII
VSPPPEPQLFAADGSVEPGARHDGDGSDGRHGPDVAPALVPDVDPVGAADRASDLRHDPGLGPGESRPVTPDNSAWAPPVHTVIGGDARCASVAAASVLAKVTRDRIMRATSEFYPAFDFERNKGYPSPAHQRALCGYGLSAVHRRSWAFVDNLPWELTTWPGDYRARASRLDGGLLGESEDALADDVAEHLVGSSGDAHPG